MNLPIDNSQNKNYNKNKEFVNSEFGNKKPTSPNCSSGKLSSVKYSYKNNNRNSQFCQYLFTISEYIERRKFYVSNSRANE